MVAIIYFYLWFWRIVFHEICFYDMVDRRKVISLISSRDPCQRLSRAGFEPVQNLILGLVEWSCAVVRTTTPRPLQPPHFLPFSVFVLTLLWIDWGRMKIVNMSHTRRGNFLTFFICSLQKPIGSYWFRKVLLELFSFSFFIKWWNSTKPFFLCISKQYILLPNFFSQKIQ